jgi:hypothetical protein
MLRAIALSEQKEERRSTIGSENFSAGDKLASSAARLAYSKTPISNRLSGNDVLTAILRAESALAT